MCSVIWCDEHRQEARSLTEELAEDMAQNNGRRSASQKEGEVLIALVELCLGGSLPVGFLFIQYIIYENVSFD